jgi:hypothetical protein
LSTLAAAGSPGRILANQRRIGLRPQGRKTALYIIYFTTSVTVLQYFIAAAGTKRGMNGSSISLKITTQKM